MCCQCIQQRLIGRRVRLPLIIDIHKNATTKIVCPESIYDEPREQRIVRSRHPIDEDLPAVQSAAEIRRFGAQGSRWYGFFFARRQELVFEIFSRNRYQIGALGRDAGEKTTEGVEITRIPSFRGMLVALRAAETNPQKQLAHRRTELLTQRLVNGYRAGSGDRPLGSQYIAYELVIGHSRTELLPQPPTNRDRILGADTCRVDFENIGPAHRPVDCILVSLKQSVYQQLAFLLGGILEVGARFLGSGQGPDRVEEDPPQKHAVIGRTTGGNAEPLQFVPDQLVHKTVFRRPLEDGVGLWHRHTANGNVPHILHQDGGLARDIRRINPSHGFHTGNLRHIRFVDGVHCHTATVAITIDCGDAKLLRLLERKHYIFRLDFDTYHRWWRHAFVTGTFADPTGDQVVTRASRLNSRTSAMRNNSRRFAEKETVQRTGNRHASSTRPLHDCFVISHRVKVEHTQLKTILPALLSVAGRRHTTGLVEDR